MIDFSPILSYNIRMSERLSPPETCKIPGAAMIKLSQWYTGESIIPIDYEQLNKPQHVVTLPHGIRTETDFSIAAFFGDNSVYEWWERDRKGFIQAIKQDRDLQLSLEAADELIERLSNPPAQDYDNKVTTLALTEMLAQVSQTAAPHVPKYIVEHEEKDTIREETSKNKSDERISEKNLEPKQDATSPLKSYIAEQLQRLSSAFSSSSIDIDFPGIEGTKDDSRKTSRRLHTLSALLNEHEETGRDRVWDDFKGNQRRVDYIDESRGRFRPPFIVTHMYTAYDPITGRLTDNPNQKKSPLRGNWSGSRIQNQIIRMPVGQIPAGQQEIRIPWPMHGISGLRANSDSMRESLSSISLYTKKNELITINRPDDSVLTDEIGNATLSISHLPTDVQQQLKDSSLTIETKYQSYGIFYHDTNVENLINGYRPHESPPTYLYPPEIQKYLKVLKQKKSDGEKNTDMFKDMASFLGNFWLTYSMLDAKPSNADPFGAYQTERVLRDRIASCEGANIMLGQLMRYFLEDNEGIAYVAGYNTSEDGSSSRYAATQNSYHLRVMYFNEDDMGYKVYDATPWGQEEHTLFESSAQKYRRAKKEWITRKNDALKRLGISRKEVKHIRSRAETTWSDFSHIWTEEIYQESFDLETLRQNGILLSDLPGWILNEDAKNVLEPGKDGLVKLSSFIAFQNGIKDDLKYHFSKPDTPINGLATFSFRFPDRNPHDRDAYTADPENLLFGRMQTEKIINDEGFRNGLYRRAERVLIEGILATQQNTEVITQFTGLLHQVKYAYQERIKAILAKSQASMLQHDTDVFFEEAPFLLLLDNPLKELPDFFTRKTAHSARGYLFPNDKLSMANKLEKQLEDWNERMQLRLVRIEELMEEAPKTLTQPPVEMTFPSLRFWPEDLKPQQEPDEDESVPEYLDPIDTFVYLYDELFPRKEGLEEKQQEF
jgi:hypothetical protein